MSLSCLSFTVTLPHKRENAASTWNKCDNWCCRSYPSYNTTNFCVMKDYNEAFIEILHLTWDCVCCRVISLTGCSHFGHNSTKTMHSEWQGSLAGSSICITGHTDSGWNQWLYSSSVKIFTNTSYWDKMFEFPWESLWHKSSHHWYRWAEGKES